MDTRCQGGFSDVCVCCFSGNYEDRVPSAVGEEHK